MLFLNEGSKFANPSFVSCALLVVLHVDMREGAAFLIFLYIVMRREQLSEYCYELHEAALMPFLFVGMGKGAASLVFL